ncbi:MAG TPA: glycosyltransferase [Usitatibacter sp.]|jgi:GT2 family glycosyltransferase|nr:glycosyltransferase [Usitatibacter sp.]
MGAVSFSLDTRLVERLRNALPISLLVETGTFKGDTAVAVLPHVERVITIEQSEALWREAAARFAGDARVEVVRGDSATELARIAASLAGQPVVFFLDAHWCVATHTAGKHSQCPLLEELDAIGRLGPQSVVLIDDARLFLAPPPEPHDVTHWPSFDEIVRRLHVLSEQHEIMVVNDVIAFYPPAAREAIHSYAREHGVDWLRARQSLEENDALRHAVEEKETVLHELDEAARQRLEDLHTNVEALRDAHEAVQQTQEALKETQDALRETQDALHETQEALREKQEALHETQEALREKQEALRETQDALHETQEALHETQEALREKHNALIDAQAAVLQKEAALAAKDAALASHEAALRQANNELIAKERVIQGLRRVVEPLVAVKRAVRSVGGMVRPLGGAVRPLAAPWRFLRAQARDARRMLRPRLGVLYQHPPIELGLPQSIPPAGAGLPSISLVTPSFRQAGFIGRTIESVISQAYPRLEYFVQDGGSDDGTVDVLRRYEDKIAGWDSTPDSGQSQAINRAFALTSGEIMGWLNSDDILLPGALNAVGTFFAAHPEIDVVYGHRVLIDGNDAEIGRWIMPPHDDEVLSWADFVPQETLFWRRGAWEKAGGRIDESFRFAMDWDLIVRFRDAGARFARLPRFIGGFRIHPQQKTSAAINEVGFREMNRIRERVLGRVPSPIEVRRAVAPYLLRHLASDLAWRARKRLGATS